MRQLCNQHTYFIYWDQEIMRVICFVFSTVSTSSFFLSSLVFIFYCATNRFLLWHVLKEMNRTKTEARLCASTRVNDGRGTQAASEKWWKCGRTTTIWNINWLTNGKIAFWSNTNNTYSLALRSIFRPTCFICHNFVNLINIIWG